MESNKGAAAILAWRGRYLANDNLAEPVYDQALRCAEALERSGKISSKEWIELVRLANEALIRVR